MIEILIPKVEAKVYLSNNILNNIVVESPKLYRTIIKNIDNQIKLNEEYLVCFENLREINVSKKIYLYSGPCCSEMDEKKVSLAIQKDVVSKISLIQNEQYLLLVNTINDFVYGLINDYPIALEFDVSLSLVSLLKILSLTYSNNSESFLESLLLKIKVLNFVFGLTIFIFLNLHDYLDTDEIDSLFKEMCKLELNMLIISSNVPKEKNLNENMIIIDKDLCEIYIDNEGEM